MNDKTFAIKIDGVTKRFDQKVAVNNLSLTVNSGEIFGFLGPNGAGKTTLVKMMNGILTPNEGTISIEGINPFEKPAVAHRYMGTLTETANMYEYMTGEENLYFYGSVFGMDKAVLKDRIEELLESVDLLDDKDKKVGDYSTGMKKRLALARAIIHYPKLVILDEPTSGLDPENARKINSLIKEYVATNNATVFICTHQLRYAQDICDRYGFINKGHIICTGTLSELIEKNSFSNNIHLKAKLGCPNKLLDQFKIQEEIYQIPFTDEEEIAELIKSVVVDGGKVYEARLKRPTLEDVYFSLLNEEAS